MEKPYLQITKSNSKAKIPIKRMEDGCFDIYAIFENEVEFIKPNEQRLLQTGLKIKFPHNWVFRIYDRSSNANKGLHTLGGLIDSGYRGEIFILVTNCSNNLIAITDLTKDDLKRKYAPKIQEFNKEQITLISQTKAIAQFILIYAPHIELDILDDIPTEDSERRTGSLGSTNN